MTIQAFRFGSLGQDSLTGTNTLMGCCDASRYQDLNSPSGTAYAVPSGNDFYITAVYTPYNTQCVIGYGDGNTKNSTSAPANWLQVTGTFEHPNTVETFTIPTLVKIPQQKTPCIKEVSGGGGLKFTAYGIMVKMT